jgi:hypothetical protein
MREPGRLHLDALHVDAPGVGGLVEEGLHVLGDALALAQDLVEGSLAHDVAQGGLGEEAGRVVGVLHVGDGHGGVGDAVVDDGVHRHGHAVLGQNLQHPRCFLTLDLSC